MRLTSCCLILAVASMSTVARADDVHLYAAGSLRAALTDAGAAFTAKTGHRVVAKFGPSGVLEKEIAGGAKADVFASANMDYPQALNRSNKSGPVLRFARNKLCALVKPGLAVDSAHLLDRMLDPAIKLGTSTPNSDPSGDYAFDVFRKAEALKPGARETLEKKALKLDGHRRERRAAGRSLGLRLAHRGGPRRHFPRLLHGCRRSAQAISRPANRSAAGRTRGRRRLRPYRDQRCAGRRGAIRPIHAIARRTDHSDRLRLCIGPTIIRPNRDERERERQRPPTN